MNNDAGGRGRGFFFFLLLFAFPSQGLFALAELAIGTYSLRMLLEARPHSSLSMESADPISLFPEYSSLSLWSIVVRSWPEYPVRGSPDPC